MALWDPTFDRKTGLRHHQTSDGFGHALLSPISSHFFKLLRVGAALWKSGEWFALNLASDLVSFENEHGVETERSAYNAKHFAQVQTKKKIVRGEHAGFSDFFVPVLVGDQLAATLVVGPFLVKRSTGADVLERFRRMTGRTGHPADPEFASYLSETLSVLVLDGGRLSTFERLLSRLAALMAGVGPADALANECHALGVELERVRLVDRMWEAVRTMVDDRTARSWHSSYHASGLRNLGLSRMADNVLVGLARSRSPELDAVDEAVRRDAYQRNAAELAHQMGDVIAGRVGDQGVVFLITKAGTVQRKRQRVLDVMERVSTLGRRQLGVSLHFGASIGLGSAAVSRGYQAALGAAETALSEGARILIADLEKGAPAFSLRRLREGLAPEAEAQAELLPARFERYLDAVSLHSGQRPDVARGYLEAGFERLTDALLRSGTLDKRNFSAMCDNLDRAAAEARSMAELSRAYRRAALDVSEAIRNPVPARQDRNLRQALDHVRQHFTEPLRLAGVARVAGFTPNYFAQLFKEREKTTFAKYVLALRIERAKQLLNGTELDVRRVAELSGFRSAQYFARMFRRALGLAPLEYRKKAARILKKGR